MPTSTDAHQLNRIEKRAIEAAAVAPVIQALAERIGWDEAIALLQNVNEREALQRGRQSRAALGATGIPELVEEVAGWGEGGIWEMEVLEQTPRTYFFNVTRCPYYEKYRQLGLETLGFAFSCCRDKPFAEGFHPHLTLNRTKTIMEGADCCDFRYILGPA